MTPVIELLGVKHAYGDHVVVDGLSLSLASGSIGCLLGPSGCGKTTVLRCIAGFESIQGGEIRMNGVPVSTAIMHVPTEKRRVGIVFQDYALFPHLTVQANVAFGLRRLPTSEQRQRVAQMLDVTGLRSMARRYPHELSGGQQQRVALARALAPQPDLLLLDEPFSNLDVDLRERLSLEVRDILKTQGSTAIMVTHDQHEAFAMADEIGIMADGRVQQWDSAYNIYHRPSNRFVADFVGQGVFLQGRVSGSGKVEIELGVLDGEVLVTSLASGERTSGLELEVLLRPDDVVHDDSSPTKAQVLHKAFRGAEILYTLSLASGARVLSLVPSHHNHAVGDFIGIRLETDHVIAFRK
jgi:iron(III) transport system ATP-binding protein